MAIKKKLPRDQSLGTTADILDGDIPIDNCDDNVSGLMGLQSSLKHSQASLNSEPDFQIFSKDPSGRYIVLYTFIARDENDVSVERGEFVTGKKIFFLFLISFWKSVECREIFIEPFFLSFCESHCIETIFSIKSFYRNELSA